MSDKTSIQWSDATWNPVTGCSKVSPGCKNCYAETHANRFWGERKFADVRTHPDRLDQPLRWRKPRRVFVNSMSDLFHEDVPFEFILKVWLAMQDAHKQRGHTFQILTKRPERMLEALTPAGIGWYAAKGNVPCPEPGIWLGVSVEGQATADERIPILLQTPAAVRFLSVEPLLEAVNLEPYFAHKWESDDGGWNDGAAANFQRLHGWNPAIGIDWVIVGGESGAHARPCSIEWIRSIVAQCKAAGVPCFVKQLGSHVAGLRDSHGGDINEFPNDLKIREFPRGEQ